MNFHVEPLGVLLPVIYGISLVAYLFKFFIDYTKSGRTGRRILLVGIVVHLIYLVWKSNFETFPIRNVFDSLSLIAFCIATVYLIIEKITEERKTGFFFVSIVFVLQTLASMFAVHNDEINELLTNPLFGIHVAFTLFGISALAVSAMYGLMYWMLAKNIKSYKFGIVYKGLPALEQLESMGRLSSIIGMILLGFGIFLGHYWAWRILGYFFTLDPKIIITDIAWLAYLGGWGLVRWKNLSGLRLGKWSFWGFLLFFFAVGTANFFANSFHSFK